MQKNFLLFVLVLFPVLLFGQNRTPIKLERAEHATGNPKLGLNYLRKPVFSHDGAILSCDSAILYNERNVFEAFGNVHINQGDTLNIYANFLNYDGNAKKAHLEKDVKLVDRENTLTTNILDYDMVAKYGEYKEDGKLVNKDATITSKTGFYFSNTRDAYFKNKVLVLTEQSTITSDNLRYNTASFWTYFYGPTNIKGRDGDKLYTENGAYNTKSENAYFGQNNRYTNGSRSLKGDSLYYFGKKGYGKAVKNIVFRDTVDQTLIRGQLGEYFKVDERILVTQNAYVGIGTKDSIMVAQKKIPDTLWLGADTLESQRSLIKNIRLLEKPIVKKDQEVGKESDAETAQRDKEKAEARKLLNQNANNIPPSEEQPKTKSRRERKKKEQENKTALTVAPKAALSDSLKRELQVKQRDSLLADSLFKAKQLMSPVQTDSLKLLSNAKPKTKKKSDSTTTKVALKALPTDSLQKPSDTLRARVIKAYHNVRLYKSNLQAKADSLYYTAADSALRWYKNPIMWSDGTQQTGDTIHVFMKNNKIYAFQVLHNGFLVNVDGDSTKFNQVKGKIMSGFFEQDELRNMYIDGNAESIYYSKNDQGVYDNVNQTVSSRLRFKFFNKELTHLVVVREVEGAVNPIDKLEKEALLTGFIWKPELRPTSKQDIIKSKSSKPDKPKTTANKAKTTAPTNRAKTSKSLPSTKQ